MKIFYAVQATGNGHLSRAAELHPYLTNLGEVDYFVSGNNSTIDFPFPIKYRSKGVSLYYSKCGGIDHMDTLKKIKPLSIFKEAMDLPLKNYDIIINDFECITSLACSIQKIHSVQLGHQASFKSGNTPRPAKRNHVGELILKNYSKSSKYMGLHFRAYDDFIFPPIIKKEIRCAKNADQKHITVYLPAFQKVCLQETFEKLPDIEFHWYLSSVKDIYKEKNITYFPIYQKLFNESLSSCHGLITGGGFETPAEALFLRKKLMSIPIKNHYEQQCNAAALAKLGVCILDAIDEHFSDHISEWYQKPTADISIEANNIQETLQFLVDNYPRKKDIFLEDQLLFI
ncbi:MAG: glycosyl transferase [Bacteroidetes bacterium]|nr:glycosyl transferase [Bacteroidota bacterium]